MKKIIFFFILFFPILSFSQKDRKVVVMDMTAINSETNYSRFYSVTNMLQSAGIPYETTTSLDSAILYPILIVGSRFENNKLSPTQVTQIENYVSNGGVVLTSSMRDSALFNLCGISGYLSDDEMFFVNWDTLGRAPYFSLVNDSLELTVSLGDSAGGGTSFFTRAYYLSTASSYANYENGLSALAVNDFGNGRVYTFGPDFRDIYIRNQLDFDLNAHRTYSNGFEPTSDVFMFVVRNIIRQHIPNSVYKYTSPSNSSHSVMITHDIDSESGMDTMFNFSNLENQRGIVAQYNVTTRYFNDGWMTSFYVGNHTPVENLLNDNHIISSHSVGHFPDFADDNIFPFGSLGNTPTNYQPFYTGGFTTNGTVVGELEVSRNLLEGDHQVNIRSFRAGHLAFPDSLAMGLMLLDYEFNSTQSANNILTGFPYYDFIVRSFNSSPSTVLEIPMTISDVFNSDPIDIGNYMQKVDTWVNVTRKYEENGAPVVLLVHPNRMYKVIAQTAYLDSLSSSTRLINMEAYGEFWRKRDSLLFHTEVSNDTLFVLMDNQLLHSEQSFVVDTVGINTVIIKDVNGISLWFDHQNYSNTQQLYYPHISLLENQELNDGMTSLGLYPNPVQQVMTVVYDSRYKNQNYIITNLIGEVVSKGVLSNEPATQLNFQGLNLQSGMYLLTITDSEQPISKKFIYQR